VKKSLSVPFNLERNDSKCIYIIESLSQLIDGMGICRSDFLIILSCNVVTDEGSPKSDDEWEIISNVKSFYNTFYPSSFELVKLSNPKIIVSEMIQVDSHTVSFYVTSSATALFVWLESPFSGRFSRNAFILLPGKSACIDFKSWTDRIDVKVFEAALAIRSLWDAIKNV
jgi:hypothetical protein